LRKSHNKTSDLASLFLKKIFITGTKFVICVLLKATALCKGVLSVAFSSELMTELKDKDFSILIDETTDISTSKLLAVIVRHWDSRLQKVVDDLLGLVDVVSTTGEGLFKAVEGKCKLIFLKYRY
jgi:hypothetical protein